MEKGRTKTTYNEKGFNGIRVNFGNPNMDRTGTETKRIVEPRSNPGYANNGERCDGENNRKSYSFTRSYCRTSESDSLPRIIRNGVRRLFAGNNRTAPQGDEHYKNGGAGVPNGSVHADFYENTNRHSESDELIHFELIPDSKIENNYVDQFIQTMHYYKPIIERFNKFRLDRSPFFSFETLITHETARFFLTIPEEMKQIAKKAVQTAWARAEMKTVPDPVYQINIKKTDEFILKYHHTFSIRVDRREIVYLTSLLDVISLLHKNEKVFLQVYAEPAAPDWHISVVEGYKQFRRGDMPNKFRIDSRGIIDSLTKSAAWLTWEAIGVMTEFISGEEPEPLKLNEGERALILQDGQLRNETINKHKGDGFKVSVRVGIESVTARARVIVRMIKTCLRSLDGDNSFISTGAEVGKEIQKRNHAFKISHDYLSIPELSRLCLLPTNPLQQQYKLRSIQLLETNINKQLTRGGLLIGQQEQKGERKNIYIPVDNYDELCLPSVVIGQMGGGKTTCLINYAAELVRNNFSCILFDPGDGEAAEKLTRILGKEKVNIFNPVNDIRSFDLCELDETKHINRSMTRMVHTLSSFFLSDDERYGQTARYLRSFLFAAQGKLSALVDLLHNSKKRKEVAKQMKEGIHKNTIETFDQETEARQRQILGPVYNRLELILGDELLTECLYSQKQLNMLKTMKERGKVTVIDLKDLEREGKDIFVNLLSIKIDVATNIRDRADRFPFFILLDEPHQYLRSAKTWGNVAVESRKFRTGYIWSFHTWEQLPQKLRDIIRSAGPKYHIFPTSKKTWRELEEEIKPYTVEEMLKLKRFHALNIIQSDGETVTPFIAKMNNPE